MTASDTAVAAPITLARPRASARGIMLCLVSAAGFGVAPVFAKEVYRAGVNVTTMLSVRFLIAAVIFWAVVAWRRPQLPPRRILLACLGLGAVGYALQAALYFGAVARIDASLAALLLYIYPAIVTLLAVALRRERTDRRRLVALTSSAAGLVLLLGTRGAAPATASIGVALALGAAVAYALYLTVADGVLPHLDVFLLSALVCSAAAISVAGVGLTTGALRAPEVAVGWLWIGLLAVVSTVLPVATLFAGIRVVGAPTAAILSCVEPAVTVAVTAPLYGETLSAGQAVGGALVLAAVVVLQVRPRRR
ncbi:MAG TPA: DMT family transporter [Micromonosporaceae bacterium]